jgi:hypothetical protein
MATFRHATLLGLSIWNPHRQRFIEFRGGYLTTDDPTDLALLRVHSDYTHGLITEIHEDNAPARPPHPRPALPPLARRVRAAPITDHLERQRRYFAVHPPDPLVAAQRRLIIPRPDESTLSVVLRHTRAQLAGYGYDARLRKRRVPVKQNQAKAFLGTILAFGRTPVLTIFDRAKCAGITLDTLRIAKNQMTIIAVKTSWTGGWVWEFDPYR